MQTVILIEEDNHGNIGIAKDYLSAIDFLINDWLDSKFEVYCGVFDETKSIKKDLGENWKNVIKSWDCEKFNQYFEGCFCLYIEEVYGT